MDTPLVRLDLYASPPPAAAEASAAVDASVDELQRELEGVRTELVQASKREQELRTALAEQVEAYERRLTEESDVSRQATMLGERDARIATMETELLERERRITNQRREPTPSASDLPAPVRGRRRAVGGPEARDLPRGARTRSRKPRRPWQSPAAPRRGGEARGEGHKGRPGAPRRGSATPSSATKRGRAASQARGPAAQAREGALRARPVVREARSAHARGRGAVHGREAASRREEHARAEAEKLRVQLASHGNVTQEAEARATAVTEAAEARAVEVEERELQLAAREAELNRREAQLGRVEGEQQVGRDLEQMRRRLEERERDLVDREARSGTPRTPPSHGTNASSAEKRLSDSETSLRDRLRELDEREAELELREASGEADVELTLEKLERGEARSAREALSAKEAELAATSRRRSLLHGKPTEWKKVLGPEEVESRALFAESLDSRRPAEPAPTRRRGREARPLSTR